MKIRLIISVLILLVVVFHFIIYNNIDNNIESFGRDELRIDECGGFIATGSVCKDGRSILLKNRHSSKPGIMKPFFYQGNNYSFIAFGTYSKDVGRPYCRMGINEKGLAIGNFDQSETISVQNWEFVSDHSSENEDYDMWYTLGNFATVKDAANWLVHHASYPCQWAIISEERGVGALVAMDQFYHCNISWINNSYTAVGNRLYCEQSSNAQMKRTQYLADQMYLQGKGIESEISNAFSIKDAALILAKDINASNVLNPFLQEPENGQFKGYYSIGTLGSICPSSSTSCMLAVSGNNSFNGSLNLVFFTSGYNPHVGLFVPISASYLVDNNDIPLLFKSGSGLQKFTEIAQVYSEDEMGLYNRSKTHYIHNTTDDLEKMMIDNYESFIESIMPSYSQKYIQNMMRIFCYNQTFNALCKYRDLFNDSLILIVPDESYTCNNICYTFNKSLPFYIVEHVNNTLKLNSTICNIHSNEKKNITITYLAEDITTSDFNQLLMELYVTGPDSEIYFNFSGFQSFCFYELIKNNQSIILQSDSKGNIIFSTILYDFNHLQIKTIDYQNQPPHADFTISSSKPYEGEIILFNASQSYDDGAIIQFNWDINNDNITDFQGEKIEYSFSKVGTFQITLTIFDSNNQSDSLTKSINVYEQSKPKGSGGTQPVINSVNKPPNAGICLTNTFQTSINEFVLFNGSCSFDSDGTIINYYWDFGDTLTSEGIICNHTYLKPGIYMVILTVIDDKGAMDTNTTKIIVNQQNSPPLKPMIKGERLIQTNVLYPFIFHAIDFDDDYLNFSIDWGDGQHSTRTSLNNTSFLINHTWNKSGIYIINISARDGLNAISETMSCSIYAGDIICYINDEISGCIINITSEKTGILFFENKTGIQYNVTEKKAGEYLIDYHNDESWIYGYLSNGTLYLNINIDQKETSGLDSIFILPVIIFACVSYLFFVKKRK